MRILCLYILVVLVSLFINTTSAQSGGLTQSIKGKVHNNFTEAPIENAQIRLLLNDSILNLVYTDSAGNFNISNVGVGTYDISITHIEFESYILPDVLVKSSRVTELQVALTESYKDLEMVDIKPVKDRTQHNNDMVTNSVRTIYVQDMKKLAGSLDDPIRVAGMMPGITSDAAFSENFISIRGNSPRGLKYTIEGVELANPTHFARIGSSGGTFTIFSMSLLDKSDIFTGAFPAEYSDALGGVFDVNFRNGSNRKHEFAVGIGTLGMDLTAEGPLKKRKSASYLVNYRYSTVGLSRLIGYPTTPTYQDLSFVLNFPTKAGNFKIIGINGSSDRLRVPEKDSTKWESSIDRYKLSLNSHMASLGLIYNHSLSSKTVYKFTLWGSGVKQVDNRVFLLDPATEITRNKNEYAFAPINASLNFKHKFSRRHTIKWGTTANQTWHRWDVLKYNFEDSQVDTLVLGNGSSQTYKAYTQSKYLLNEKNTLNVGVSGLYHSVNQGYSVEPRIGFIHKLKKNAQVSLALGQHSQVEHFATYLYRESDENGADIFPNKNLSFIRAYHAIAGYRANIFKNHIFTTEIYYQHLYDVPTEVNGTYSVLNLGELNEVRALENIGDGRNYGIDLGIERYASHGLYYLINCSVFESIYKDGNGDWRSTQFDQKFNLRFLLGKEYKIVNEDKNRINYLGWNTNTAYVGGRPYTPLDITASRLEGETIFNESLAFTENEEALLFMDLTLTYRINKPKTTAIWSLQIKNIFSNGNAIYREYDAIQDSEVTVPSSSFFPNLSYRIEF